MADAKHFRLKQKRHLVVNVVAPAEVSHEKTPEGVVYMGELYNPMTANPAPIDTGSAVPRLRGLQGSIEDEQERKEISGASSFMAGVMETAQSTGANVTTPAPEDVDAETGEPAKAPVKQASNSKTSKSTKAKENAVTGAKGNAPKRGTVLETPGVEEEIKADEQNEGGEVDADKPAVDVPAPEAGDDTQEEDVDPDNIDHPGTK